MPGKPTYNRKVDANQADVIAEVRKFPGLTVQDLHGVGNGVPDLIIGFLGQNFLVELKDGSKPKHQKQLTEPEKEWHQKWKGQVAICESAEDIFKLITGQYPYHDFSDRNKTEK